jgi:serine/threonine-protein kinase
MLGSGGMGTVYLARSPDLPRFEAIKVLSAELSRDPDFRARFVREADVAAGLDHPNVVSIYRRGEFEGQLWIAMQFVDGTDADGALQDGAMTPVRAVHVVTEVAKALDYAHSRGVVHRDVKPGNFLLSGPVGPDERVLLGDFGIARALDDAKLTATGSFMATVSYAAPEVLAGERFDGRADQYSLGCTLFRLLSGEPPFASPNGMAAVLASHLTAPPPRISDRVPGLSTRMDAVIARAMAKNPGARFDSAREFAAAAAQALRDEDTTVALRPVPGAAVAAYVPEAPAPTMGATQAWQQRGGPVTYPPSGPASGPVPMPGPGPFLPAPPGRGHFPGSPPGHFPGPFAPPPRPRRRRWIAVAVALVVLVAAGVGATFMMRSQDRPAPTSASGSTASAAATAPSLSASTLPSLLLPSRQVAELVGAPSMVVTQNLAQVADDSAAESVFGKDADCVGALLPAQHRAYAKSGWNAARRQDLTDGNEPALYMVAQAVITFQNATVAKKVLADQISMWSSCSGRTMAAALPGKPLQHTTFGPLTNTEGVVSMTQIKEDINGWRCQRAMTARDNVIVDVSACRADATNQGIDVLNAILAKFPK